MRNFHNKIRNNDGFTLTEVMIGMTVLTVAIIAATNLVIGLMRSNSNNVKTLQAYYLAQEGIELVRNVRDTNWLHNVDWLSGIDGDGKEFGLSLENAFPVGSAPDDLSQKNLIMQFAPWRIEVGENDKIVTFLRGETDLTSDDVDENGQTKFKRSIVIEDAPACEDDFSLNEKCDYKLVTSCVNWIDGSKEHEFYLETILTNWKDGVF